jgi:lipopolysaccharide/colanic/teichoic acid biosynthesis glycosyltransferase
MSEMFMTVRSPDIAKKAELPQDPAVSVHLQEQCGPDRAVRARRSGITGIWQVWAGNVPAFTTQTRFDTDHRRQLSGASDFTLPLTTVRAALRGTGP